MQKVSVTPELLQRAMKATGTRSAQAAVRSALVLAVQRAEFREMELRSRPAAVRRLARGNRGPITIVRDFEHLRQLTGV